jgi:outer membrane protein assembly factor BamB/formylglycine-generating enzyme required for sulfatase activity
MVSARPVETPVDVPRRPNLRIVDYGSDMGSGVYRGRLPMRIDVATDTGDDPDVQQMTVSGWPFSLDEPLSPSGPEYNTQAPSGRYYGGIVGFHANQGDARISEGFLNENHELRDDCNFMGSQRAAARRAEAFVRGYALWFWQKQDFLNRGHERRVTFNDDSLMAVHVSRYWDSVDAGRWVVRDDDTFYISEQQFGTPEAIEGRGRKTRLTWFLWPSETRWAVYEPAGPAELRFRREAADFRPHSFDDVTGVGFYMEKDSRTPGVISVKWHSFEAYAVVDLPQDADIHVKTEPRPARGRSSTGPVSYALWQQVCNWAVSNQFCMDLDQRGYVFDRHGEIEGMSAITDEVGPTEPAVGMTWLDVVAWCNALSELEGLEPAYYADPGYTEVLRAVRDRSRPERYDWRPEVHEHDEASGYRLMADRADPRDLCLYGFSVRRGSGDGPDRGAGRAAFARREMPTEEPRVLLPESFVRIEDGTYKRSDEATVTVTDFSISETEVTFADYRRLVQWAERHGYSFDRQGSMGSMDWWPAGAARLQGVREFRAPSQKHVPDEPVTNVGWWDALVWCNALSELHGREPVYYTNEEMTEVLRRALPYRIRMVGESGIGHAGVSDLAVHTKWQADGYRLPTWAEWNVAWRAGETRLLAGRGPEPFAEREADCEWLEHNSEGRTHPVGRRPANAYGLHDMGGNVAEWLHDNPRPDYYRPDNPKGSQTTSLFGMAFAGGHFNSPARGVGAGPEHNRKSAAWPWLGFRVVRCDAEAHSDKPFVPEVVLDVQAEDFDPLQGRAFRGNTSRTGFLDGDGPPSNPKVRWTFRTGAEVVSSPVVVGGRAYVGSNDGHFYCLDAGSGELVWKVDTGGPVTGSATLDRDGIVYIGSGSGWLYALDADTGELVWRYAHNPNSPGQRPVTTSPAVAYGVVFAGFGQWGGHFGGVDAGSGQEVWRLRGYSPNPGPLGPSVHGTVFYAPVSDNRLAEVSLRTEIPRTVHMGHHCQASVAVTDDLIAYNCGPGCKIIRRSDGKTVIHHWVGGEGLSFFPHSGPALHEGMAYFAKGNRKVYAFRATPEEAELIWSSDTPLDVRSSITVAGSCIYFGCDDGHVFALDRMTGEEKWRFRTGGAVVSTPWVADGVLYVGSEDGCVYAIE